MWTHLDYQHGNRPPRRGDPLAGSKGHEGSFDFPPYSSYLPGFPRFRVQSGYGLRFPRDFQRLSPVVGAEEFYQKELEVRHGYD